MRLLSLPTLEAHRPRYSCNELQGCMGCGWSCGIGDDADRWARFLNHVPVAVSDGEMPLTKQDVENAHEWWHIDLGPMEEIG